MYSINPYRRVSMGLTVSHKAAQKLVVRNKNGKILTVSREKKLTVKKKFWRKQWNDINRQP